MLSASSSAWTYIVPPQLFGKLQAKQPQFKTHLRGHKAISAGAEQNTFQEGHAAEVLVSRGS